MSFSLTTHKSIPFGALITIEKPERDILSDKVFSLPNDSRKMLIAPRTGAYLRGLAKQQGLAQQQLEKLALLVLRVVVGDQPRDQLAHAIAGHLAIGQDIAQKIAREIEHDLFAPISRLVQSKPPTPEPQNSATPQVTIEATVAKINQQAIEINKQMLAYQVAENNGQDIEEERRNYIRTHEAYSVANLQKPHIAKTRTEAERENILTYGSREQIKALLGHQEVKNMMSPRERKRVQSPKAATPSHTKTADMKNVLDLKSQTRKNPPQPPSLPPTPNHRP